MGENSKRKLLYTMLTIGRIDGTFLKMTFEPSRLVTYICFVPGKSKEDIEELILPIEPSRMHPDSWDAAERVSWKSITQNPDEAFITPVLPSDIEKIARYSTDVFTEIRERVEGAPEGYRRVYVNVAKNHPGTEISTGTLLVSARDRLGRDRSNYLDIADEGLLVAPPMKFNPVIWGITNHLEYRDANHLIRELKSRCDSTKPMSATNVMPEESSVRAWYLYEQRKHDENDKSFFSFADPSPASNNTEPAHNGIFARIKAGLKSLWGEL